MRSAGWFVVAGLAMAAGGCGKKAESGGGQAQGAATNNDWLGAKTAAGTGATATAATPTAPATGTSGTAGAGAPATAGGTEAPAAPAELQPPRLGFAKGKVQVIDSEGTHEIAEGTSILPGSVVVVDPEAQAEIDLPDGSVVDIAEMTELLIRDAAFDGKVRDVDLAVLSGSVRVHAAKNDDPESMFRISTPSGTTEVQGTEYALEVEPKTNATGVVVFDGHVNVKAGETVQAVVPVAAGTPAAVRIVPATGIAVVPPPPVIVDEWDDWNDRQADDLIERYDVDIQQPEVIAAPVLVVETNPYWRPQIELRRLRIANRAHVLVAVVGPQQLVVLPNAHARFVFAREAWVPVVYAPRAARIAPVREVRYAVWTGAVEARVEARAVLMPVMVEARTVWIDHKGKIHGRGHGHDAVVVMPFAPPPAVVVGGPVVVVRPPAVTVVAPSVTIGVPGVAIGVGGGVHVGGGVRVGGPPPPVVVVPGGGGPPPPTIVVPGGGHGRGHDEHGEGEGRGHGRHDH